MATKLTPKVILEGTRLTFKTDIAFGLMDGLVAASRLATLRLDVSDNDISGAVERIADWLERTGGLYMD